MNAHLLAIVVPIKNEETNLPAMSSCEERKWKYFANIREKILSG